MNAVDDNRYTRAWRELGAALPRPAAIVSVSAHWYVPGSSVTAMAKPRTIHDFRGFPAALYEIEYPAPGSPSLAAKLVALLEDRDVTLDADWGLDHGTWAVLRHLYPDADVPIVQLSIDCDRPARFHYETGRLLGALRDDGIMIVGSGNVVHNLARYAWDRAAVPPRDWAARFDARVRRLLEQGDHDALIDYERGGADAALSVPTPEHYLPLLYVAGASRAADTVSFPAGGIEGGTVSMLAVAFA